MGSGIFTANTTIKYSAAVNTSTATTGQTLYTVPADSFGIFTIFLSSTSGNVEVTTTLGRILCRVATTQYGTFTPIYLGAGATIVSGIATTGAVYVTGVVYTNSP